jgi:eukaryotic-like serine/threonine-protein kinase
MVEAPAPRMHLGAYEPLLQLATGGMATVYVARQIGAAGFERLVVVKRVHPHLLSNREFYDMFRDEARLAAMLHHPNVVAVTDVVESEGELFLVMEYVDSVAVSTLLKTVVDKRERLPPAVVVRILVDALSGLHAAHEAVDMRGNRLEIVHRDVSPQNVIVGGDGSSRLIDFGVAKARHRLTETKSGSLKGKYGYMSPEQAKAQPIDRRADLFSAGVVLWETLTAARLFRGENEFDTIRRITEEPVPAPSTLAPAVPRGVDAVVLKALARDRAARFQTAADFIEALEAACLPAPTRDVGAVVKRLCGDRLDARRSTLHDMLEGHIAPLSVTRVSSISDDDSTHPSAPTSKRRLLHRGTGDEGTDGQIAATHDAFAPRAISRRTPWIAGSLVAAVATIIVMGSLAGRRTAPATQAAASASVPPAPATVAADEVVLELSAESPIESVRALGMRDVSVRGSQARLVVARWGGELGIDAVLEGGTAAHAVALSDGPRDIVLAPVITAIISAPRPAASAPVGPASRPGAHARPNGAATPGAPTSELQSNPYGP